MREIKGITIDKDIVDFISEAKIKSLTPEELEFKEEKGGNSF